MQAYVVTKVFDFVTIRPGLITRRKSTPHIQLLEHPTFSVANDPGNPAFGTAPGRADSETVFVHGQHDAFALLTALQKVSDVPVTQPNALRLANRGDRKQVAYERALPRRVTSFSIQSSAFRLSASGAMPAGWITGPMLTVMIPGYFTKAFFPQTLPALCAIGKTGVPVLQASHAPPK